MPSPLAISEAKRLLLTVVLCFMSFQLGRVYYKDGSSDVHGQCSHACLRSIRPEDPSHAAGHPELFEHSGRKFYIDIGANNGDSFVQCHKFNIDGMCKDGKWNIIAVEGNPLYNNILHEKQKLLLDKKLVSSVILYNATVMDTRGRQTVEFAIDRSNAGLGSTVSADALVFRNKVQNKKDKDIVNLPTITMRRIFEENSIHIRDYVVLKIDVEGYEYELLPYLISQGLLQHIDVLAVEYHDNNVWFYNGLSAEKQAELHDQTKCLKWVISKADRVRQHFDWN